MSDTATHNLDCADCGAPMRLKKSKYGKFYGCTRYPKCDGIHGAHQESGAPLGTPANKATRQARIAAHAAFDAVWKRGFLHRSGAYRWLADALGITTDECHIGQFDAEMCRRVVEVCRIWTDQLPDTEKA